MLEKPGAKNKWAKTNNKILKDNILFDIRFTLFEKLSCKYKFFLEKTENVINSEILNNRRYKLLSWKLKSGRTGLIKYIIPKIKLTIIKSKTRYINLSSFSFEFIRKQLKSGYH